MTAAVTVWNQRVAPVFDTAQRIVLLDTGSGENVGSLNIALFSLHEKILKMQEHGVEILVCGAISKEASRHLTDMGIRLYACVAGELEEVVSALLSGALERHALRIPPCPCCKWKWNEGQHVKTGKCAKRKRL